METRSITVLIMAAGTGGHVFPALSIAHALKSRSINVEWLGTNKGMENQLLEDTDIPLHRIPVRGLTGAGILRWVQAPFMLLVAFFHSYRVLRTVNPDAVIGMGGFVCGPAGLACKALQKPLLIHEQNAVAGITNKLLARLADRIFEAFPDTFPNRRNLVHTGNPLREAIVKLAHDGTDHQRPEGPLRLLVLGGSQGALAINQLIPELIANYRSTQGLETLHQTGEKNWQDTESAYVALEIAPGEKHKLVPFITDMAAAYQWADLVVCRSGASTVSEIAAAGLPAIFVPYPHHKDQQQTLNANWLARSGAAIVLQQQNLDAALLSGHLLTLDQNRNLLMEMGSKARSMAILDADQRIADACLELLNA